MKLRAYFLLILLPICLAALSCGKKGDPFLPAKQEGEVRAGDSGEGPRPPASEEQEEETEGR